MPSMATSEDRAGHQAAASASRAALKRSHSVGGGHEKGVKRNDGKREGGDDDNGAAVEDYLTRMEELERQYEERHERRPSSLLPGYLKTDHRSKPRESPKRDSRQPAAAPVGGLPLRLPDPHLGSISRSVHLDAGAVDSGLRADGRVRVTEALRSNPALWGLPRELVRRSMYRK